MQHISAQNIASLVSYSEIIAVLFQAFSSFDFKIPQRGHYELPDDNLSLVMPAWNNKYYGLKQIIACPENPKSGLSVISGRFDLFNVSNGVQLCSIDAAKLTSVRTAATSLLASSLMVTGLQKLFIFGAGEVAEQLILAYQEYYNPSEIWIHNRTYEKACLLKDKYAQLPIHVSENPKRDIQNSEIILCATHTNDPILFGSWINFKTQISLIGAYKKDQREADDELIRKASVYIEDYGGVLESGELAIPIRNGILKQEAIKASLFELCRNKKSLDNSPIRIFKSVGHAIEDLATAIYFYERILRV